MIFITGQLESKDIKLNKVFPLRTSLIPKYITIDTTTLFYICGKFLPKGATLSEYKNKFWNLFFKIKDKNFHGMIKTDGVGASVILIKNDNEIDAEYLNKDSVDATNFFEFNTM